MTININSKELTVNINGADYSAYLGDFSAVYSSSNILSGVSYMTGNIKLNKPANLANINFDPRFSSTFSPGGFIQIFRNGLLLPVIGTSYIISANYDRRTSLDLSVGCILSRNNNQTSRNSSICIDFGALYPVGDVIQTLLQAAGINISNIWQPDIIALNDFKLAEPFQLNNDVNLIQSAAQLARQYGRLIFQDNAGRVRVRSVYQTIDNYVYVQPEEALLTYTLSSQPEQAVKIIEATYNELEILSLLGTTSSSAASNEFAIETLVTRDDNLKTTSTNIKEFRLLTNGVKALVSETTINSQFETSATIARNGQLSKVSDCYPDTPSRILSRTTTTQTDNTEVLQAWLAYQAAASVPSGFTVSGVITSANKIEQWTYLDSIITYEQTIFSPIAKVIPLTGDRQLNSSNSPATDINPLTLIPEYKLIEVYSRSFENSERWTKNSTEYVNKSLVDPNAVAARAQVTGASLDIIISDQSQLIPINNTIEFSASLPTFDTFNSDIEVASSESTIVVGTELNTGLVSSISLGNYYQPSFDFLQQIVKAEFEYTNGRIFSAQIAAPLPDPDIWASLIPLAPAKVLENTGNSMAYKIDSPAITYSATELVFSCTGVCLGYETTYNTNIYAENLLPLPFAPQATIGTLYSFEDIEYNINATFTEL